MYPPEGNVLGVAALISTLVLAAWRDLQCNRIDNWITFPAAFFAITAQAYLGGLDGFVLALSGLAVGLALFLPFHVLGGMAAGDVKLMAAAGAFLGPLDALIAVAASLLVGSVTGLCVLAARGGLPAGLNHIGRQWLAASVTRVWVNAAPGTVAAHRFPYAIAIAIGCLAVLAWRQFIVLPG